MTDRGVVFDLGYKPHDGPRLGTPAAVRATMKDGIRRVLGIRRKARKKVLPWLLLGVAALPAIVFVGLAFFLGEFSPDTESPFGGHPEYFLLAGTMIMLFSALAGPELLVPDREEGVLAVYSSRPMRARDYVLARAGALAVVVFAFLFIPNLLMWFGFSALDDAGFVSGAADRLDDLVKILAASVVYVLGYGVPSLFAAIWAKRNAPATGLYLAGMFGSVIAAGLLIDSGVSGSRFGALGALIQHPNVVTNWIFGRSSSDLPAEAGFEPWVSLVVILVVAAITIAAAIRRYRREL